MFSSAVVTVNAVKEHLRQMNSIFEEISLLNTLQLYQYLLNMADRYEKNNDLNFAAVVHMLHPRLHNADE